MGWGAVVEPVFVETLQAILAPRQGQKPTGVRKERASDLESISDALMALSHSIFTMDAVASGTGFPLKYNCSNFLPKRLSAHYIFSKALDLKHTYLGA
jgi:hypothetical protein